MYIVHICGGSVPFCEICIFLHFSFVQFWAAGVLINCTYLWRRIYAVLCKSFLCTFERVYTVHICGGSVTEGQLPRTAAPEQMALDDDDDVFCVV